MYDFNLFTGQKDTKLTSFGVDMIDILDSKKIFLQEGGMSKMTLFTSSAASRMNPLALSSHIAGTVKTQVISSATVIPTI